MRIACISYHLPPFDQIGAGYQMHYTANAYVRHGHDVTMFSPYGERPGDALYDMVRVPVGRTNRTFRFAWSLKDQDFTGFDLLHAAGDDYWMLGKKRPFHIRTFHGSCFAEARRIEGARGKLRMTLLGLSEWMACAVADRKVSVSHNNRRYIPFAKDVVWNGVDLSAFRPGTSKSERPSILFVGTMDHRKRGGALLEIFQREIRPRMPDAELWIAREEKPVVADGVRWFGRVPLEKLVELYQQSWVFCLPSSYEGFGVPYIEAMACGTPVVATPNDGALEVLERGKYGRIADLPDLGTAILELLGDDGRRTRMQREGVVRALEFSWDNVVRAYLSMMPAPELRPAHRLK